MTVENILESKITIFDHLRPSILYNYDGNYECDIDLHYYKYVIYLKGNYIKTVRFENL